MNLCLLSMGLILDLLASVRRPSGEKSLCVVPDFLAKAPLVFPCVHCFAAYEENSPLYRTQKVAIMPRILPIEFVSPRSPALSIGYLCLVRSSVDAPV